MDYISNTKFLPGLLGMNLAGQLLEEGKGKLWKNVIFLMPPSLSSVSPWVH